MRAPDFQIRAELQRAFSEFNQGQAAAAQARATAILQKMPREPNALYLVGIIHHQAGRLDEAARYFEKSYKIDPDNPAALSGIGIVRMDQGRFGEAIKAFVKLARTMPNDAQVQNNLGIAYKGTMRYDLAIQCFERAIHLNPNFADPYVNFGSLLNSLGEAVQAKALLEKGLRANPDDRSLHLNLSDALVGLGDFAAARELLDRFFAEDPVDPEVRSRMGFLLTSLGEVDAARELFQESIRLDPENVTAHFDLADLVETKGNAAGPAMQHRRDGIAAFRRCYRMLLDAPPVTTHRAAQAAESLRDHDLSFQYFKAAQEQFRMRLASVGKSYDRRATELLYDGLIAHFRGLEPGEIGVPDEGPAGGKPQPIFIVGMPRSGTSLLEQILASHPRIHGGGELMSLPILIDGRTRAGETLVDLHRRLTREDWQAMRAGYLDEIAGIAGGAAFVTDKLPFNFINVGVIRTLFPTALILNIERNPLDVCWSIFTQRFASEMLFDHDLRDIGHYYRHYDRLMGFWKQWDASIVPIQYEALLEDMGQFILPVLDRIGLDWDPKMERFFENKRVVQTASRLQVRRPIYKSSVGRWSPFESHLGGLKAELGDLVDPVPDPA